MDKELLRQLDFSLGEVVAENIKNNVFSACSVGIIEGGTYPEKTIFHYGITGRAAGGKQVDNRTIYDLASLTKPLVTSLSILALIEEGKLKLSDSLADFFPRLADVHKKIKIINLLEHTSGFPAHRAFFKELITTVENEREAVIIGRITQENLLFEPGAGELYSDLGYILLGKIIEKVSGEKLDSYWQRIILGPLGLEKGLFFAANRNVKASSFSATGFCQWSNRELCGVVNDDNCRSLGGVAGHAGLFGTIEALVQFCEIILKMYCGTFIHPKFSFELLRERLTHKRGRWVLGFDTPSGLVSSSGKHFSFLTLGHLGFTGTSFWLDCKKMRGVVLLTNRVLGSEDLDLIRKFRPQIHDLIMEKITKEKGK